MWTIEFYETENRIIPVEKFLDSLDIKMRAKALKELQILKEFGISLREPYSKSIKDGIFELRIKVATDITRIFYFFYKDNKIILTNGFIKKTQKTPSSEIETAVKYKKDYIRRYGK
jgi:phage-related protein